MKSYKAYCFDLDGTVYRGKAAIDSAVAFIHYLQSQQIEPFYVTNNSSKTPEQLQQSLHHMGIVAPISHIYSSALATAKYVANNCPDKLVHVIGEDGLRAALEQEGLIITDTPCSVLVMGIDRNMTYDKLVQASLAVQKGAQLIGTNADIKFPTENGFVPGNGSLVHLVANVAGVEPIFIGKPSPVMLQMIAQEHGYAKEDMLMIGDNYDTDILCGIHFGCDTLHANTGVTPTYIVKQQATQPTYCIDNLLELITD